MEREGTYGFGGEAEAPARYASDEARQSEADEVEQKRALERKQVEDQVKSGAGWFYWIAGLSVVNTVLLLFEADWRFLTSLSVVDLISVYALVYMEGAELIALGVSVMLAVVLVGFGIMAGKGRTWAFVVGMSLYALDALLALMIQDWIGLAFHGLALFYIFGGLRAGMQLAKMEKPVVGVALPPGWVQ